MKVKIIDKLKEVIINAEEGEFLLPLLRKNELLQSAVCGGKGLCGKCTIKVLNGDFEITQKDKEFFSNTQLSDGFRLACCAKVMTDCTIKMETNQETFEVITVNEIVEKSQYEQIKEFDRIGIAIDIGTTTIAMQLINCKNGMIIDTYTDVNHQRAYGSDVISRIQSSREGNLEELQERIQKDLLNGFHYLVSNFAQQLYISEVEAIEKVEKIVIAANTTMIHLLMGYSCEGLGTFPFKPITLDLLKRSFYEVFSDSYLDVPVVILPGISTFVGGDIVSGMLLRNFYDTEEISLLVDLGTNGEMALGNADKIMVTSTAAGPAFEGGNIKDGMGSIQGAISQIRVEKEEEKTNVFYETIGNTTPKGICGTGVVDMVYELLRNEIIDEMGTFRDEGQDAFVLAEKADGSVISFTQNDIRQLQYAKAAIRSGIDLLIQKYGIVFSDVKHIFLAGGFGYKIDISKAIGIGMIPEEFKNRTLAIGNSSLGGAIIALTNDDYENKIAKICSVSKEITLALEDEFNEQYLENMYFRS